MLVTVYEVLDTTECPAVFYKLGLMNKDGRSQIMKWIPVPGEALTYRAIRIDSMPVRELVQAQAKLEGLIALLDRSGRVTRHKPVHKMLSEVEDQTNKEK